MTADTIEVRVARGAALLDEKLPGWADHIELDRLRLTSSCNCVLGQAFREDVVHANSYRAGLINLFDSDYAYDEAVAHGFDLGDWEAESGAAWLALTAEWKRVILSRRESASSTPRGAR
jgi:hypothetical protein